MHLDTKDLSYFEICGSCNSYDVQFHGYKIKLTLVRRQEYDKTTTLRHLAIYGGLIGHGYALEGQ